MILELDNFAAGFKDLSDIFLSVKPCEINFFYVLGYILYTNSSLHPKSSKS